jgi:hypothetical protein
VRANQVEEEGVLRFFLADEKQDPDGLGLDLDDPQQIHDRAAAFALLVQRPGGGLRDALEGRHHLRRLL